MNLIEKVNNIKSKIKGKITFNENLSKFSWFNIGGPAKIVFRPFDIKDLSFFLKEIKIKKDIKVLGLGSNTLIRDGGYNGIIIKLGKTFSHISKFSENIIISGVSALDTQVANFALNHSLSGFEFLLCIPGSIGGAVRMNSGCYGEDISNIIVSVQAMDLNGSIRVIPYSKIKFYYRGSDLSNELIFISSTFKGSVGNKKDIKKKMENFLETKKKSQPSKIKTCGSTFKNLKNKKAWELIKESGCNGMRVGDAQISEKHCNFFVNNGNAKSSDLEELINKVKKNVFDHTGNKLELELQIIGNK
jgi:UDP-N-acetylmuramate dehydrogenase